MKRIPREKSTLTEFGAHLKPELVVDPGEKFVIETNDNWWKSARTKGCQATSNRAATCRAASLSSKSGWRSSVR